MKKRISLAILAVILALLFIYRDKPRQKLNVVLIVIDALRADHLSCYGYDRLTSPLIDEWAKKGVLFTSAFSQGPQTNISVASLLTSLYPGVHGVVNIVKPLRDEFITLPQVLAKNGYKTAAFAGPSFKSVTNVRQRFQSFDMSTRVEVHPESLGQESPYKFGVDSITPQITRKVLAWLRRYRHTPFFVYVHYMAVHAPYLSPDPYPGAFWKGAITEDMKGSITHFTQTFHGRYFRVVPPDLRDFLVSQYDGEIRYIDTQIDILLAEMEKLGLLGKTLVILTSDHGEAFFEHGTMFHGYSVYDELVHVPLVVFPPEARTQARPQGRIIPDIVRHVDIMPTILEALDIRPLETSHGESFLPLLRGQAMDERVSYSQGESVDPKKHFTKIRTKEWSYIHTCYEDTGACADELYKIRDDPRETNDLSLHDAATASRFRAMLKEYDLLCQKARNAALGQGAVIEDVSFDDKTKEDLRSLGYLQ